MHLVLFVHITNIPSCSAWNCPVAQVVLPWIGAIAAGCCAVLKPSEIAPHSAEVLGELCPQYLDPSAYRVVLGGIPETTALLELQCAI